MYILKDRSRPSPAIQPKPLNGNSPARTVIPLSVRSILDPKTAMERHGRDDLGAAVKAGFQYGHRGMRWMWLPTWKRQGIIRPDCRDWPGRGSKRWRVSRPGWRHSGLDSDTWTGGYSINVDFSEKGFYFSAPPDRLCHTIFLPSNYAALCYLPLALQPSSPHAKVEARESGR